MVSSTAALKRTSVVQEAAVVHHKRALYGLIFELASALGLQPLVLGAELSIYGLLLKLVHSWTDEVSGS